MGRWGWGILDSEMAWDVVGDLSDLAGLNLNMIGCSEEDDFEGPPIMSEEEARVHLDNGNFDKVFERLQRSGRNDYLLCLFVAVAMTVGAKIKKRQIDYLKEVYWTSKTGLFCGGVRQMKLALQEYQNGEPYKLKDFDDECDDTRQQCRNHNPFARPFTSAWCWKEECSNKVKRCGV